MYTMIILPVPKMASFIPSVMPLLFTDATLELLRSDRGESPVIFYGFHYFDPHAPYDREFDNFKGGTMRRCRIWIVRWGRLLCIAETGMTGLFFAVGDHGEGLGDHGEDTHGDMLYSNDTQGSAYHLWTRLGTEVV